MNIKFLDREKFCIKHQKMVEISILKEPHTGETSVGHLCALFAPDWGWCEGPFTACPPPEMEEDWEKHVVPPDFDELVEMDILAQELVTSWA